MQRILIILAFMASFFSKAQIHTHIYVDGLPSKDRTFTDSLVLKNYLQGTYQAWVEEGYLFSGLDSVKTLQNKSHIFLHKGEKVIHNLEGLSRKKLLKQIDKKLDSFSENGYPFARIAFDSSRVVEGILKGRVSILKGPEITYDSLYLFKEIKTNTRFIYQLLDLAPNDPFKESSYDQVEKRIETSSFLALARKKDISFQSNKAKVYLDIKESKANSFQGVLGLQQSNNRNTNVVGSLDLDIKNLFRSGKELRFFWERFSENSQQLDIYYKHPFFLDSKIHPSLSFSLLKQDTSFLTRHFGVGLSTFISPKTSLKISFENTNGTLISTEESVLRTQQLADYNRNQYKVELSRGNFSSLTSLNEAMVWSLGISGGNKEITRNASLPDTYYDTLNLKTNFFQFDLRLGAQLKIGQRQTLFSEIRSGGLDNEEVLNNELYRSGGLQSVRGFNEKNFFAQYYALSRFELRSFFETGSYAYVFYDQLYFEREQSEYPFGIGLGFVLATSSGQFTFALASGNSRTQEISFSEMKAHFGYISRF